MVGAASRLAPVGGEGLVVLVGDRHEEIEIGRRCPRRGRSDPASHTARTRLSWPSTPMARSNSAVIALAQDIDGGRTLVNALTISTVAGLEVRRRDASGVGEPARRPSSAAVRRAARPPARGPPPPGSRHMPDLGGEHRFYVHPRVGLEGAAQEQEADLVALTAARTAGWAAGTIESIWPSRADGGRDGSRSCPKVAVGIRSHERVRAESADDHQARRRTASFSSPSGWP